MLKGHYMLQVTIKELEEGIDKYIDLGQEEEIRVLDGDKVLFYITPARIKLIHDVESMFGTLPREAYYDDDIDRE